VNLKEERIANEDNAAEVAAALEAEGDKMLSRVPPGAYTVALCVEGKEIDSPALARELGAALDRCGKLCFLIGSSHGLADEVKSAADLRLSVSKLTFPHQLMRVVLLECVYRCMSIIKGTKYHK
jgi:23S rRNA (pseudouridine1915-N3)-methyltransferase